MDTICALATAPGRAGVAIIRVSGPEAFGAARLLAGPLPDVGRHALRRVRGADGEVIDQALVLVFAGPHSFTGEDVVEFQVHGSVAGTSAVLSALHANSGIRLAEPGEFTRRALENGRMDLTQVEGLADLIEAETQAQLRQAVQTTEGVFSAQLDVLRADLTRAAALIEATIDFADEDVPTDVTPEVSALMSSAQDGLEQLLAGSRAAERIREGFEVAIVGAPNAGKSTLLNRLAQREAAITSDIAGTTRDVIEVSMDISGLPVTLLDTAGIRDSEDHVERLGIELARRRAESADLRIILDSGAGMPIDRREDDLVVVAKDDAGSAPNGISGLTGNGVDRLLSELARVLGARVAGVSLASRERHRRALGAARESLLEARRQIEIGLQMADIAAEELRSAIRQLEVLLGRIGVEDLLTEIFSSFCIGK